MDISIVKKVWQVVNAGSNGMPDGVGCLYLAPLPGRANNFILLFELVFFFFV